MTETQESGHVLFVFVRVLALIVCFFIAPAVSKRPVTCYYSNWAQYRPSPGTYVVSNIDPFGCNIFIFAFAQLNGNSMVAYEINDDQSPFMWRQFTDIKKQNPDALCCLALGGYSHGTDRFRTMASSSSNRAAFAQNVIDLLRYWKFDCLDLDWEYVEATDRDFFSVLVKELVEAFIKEGQSSNRPRLKLLAAVPAGIPRLERGYDIAFLNQYLDYFNVMAYDYHGSWENVTAPATPLRAPEGDNLNVVSTLNYYVQQGASKEKIIVGLSTFGRSWTLERSGDTAIGSPAVSGGTAQTYTREPGFMSYYEVCQNLRNGFVSRTDELSAVKIATLGNQWITYEDASTLEMKLDYITTNGFGGAMVWAPDHDDFNGGFCGNGAYPLLRVIFNRMFNAPDVSNNTTSPIVALTASTSINPTTSTTTTMPSTTPSTTTTSTTTPSTTSTTTTPSATPSTAPPTTTAPQPTTAPPTTTAPLSTTAEVINPSPGNGRKFNCPDSSGVYPEPNSCKIYYVCMHDRPYTMTCQNDLIFNRETNKCVSPATYQCQV